MKQEWLQHSPCTQAISPCWSWGNRPRVLLPQSHGLGSVKFHATIIKKYVEPGTNSTSAQNLLKYKTGLKYFSYSSTVDSYPNCAKEKHRGELTVVLCRIELHPEGMWAAILDKESRCSNTAGAPIVQPE